MLFYIHSKSYFQILWSHLNQQHLTKYQMIKTGYKINHEKNISAQVNINKDISMVHIITLTFVFKVSFGYSFPIFSLYTCAPWAF